MEKNSKIVNDELICEICDKKYKNKSGIWKHNNKYHNYILSDNSLIMSEKGKKTSDNSLIMSEKSIKNYECSKCYKIFNNRKTRWSHEKNCNNKINYKLLFEKEEKEKNELKLIFEKKLDDMKKEILELIKKNCKVHPRTLTNINKQLNDNKVINNNIVNKNYVIQMGNEKLNEVFSKKEQMNVLEQGYKCLDYLIEYVHFNPKYPQFKNILITNLQNNIAYKYNSKTKNFDVIKKNELLDDLINERMYDITEFFDKYGEEISVRMQKVIQSFIDKMNLESYGENKKKDIKIIIYNNRNSVEKYKLLDCDKIDV
jgi:hypothetical protein